MTMGMGHGRRGRVSSNDVASQKKINAEAPKIPHLFKRITALFKPYVFQITVTIILVLITAALSIWPPLLIQRIFDDALFTKHGVNIHLLFTLLIIMVVILLASGALGVLQTWLTSRVGNKVMGVLRVRLFDHLQKMELGFFTKTKTGVIQSRLANDVGGVANVLTNTVSNVVGNTVTIIASLVTMLILSWQLTIVAIILVPVLVLVQRRVGQVRARIAGATQESLSDMTAITQETLSVSGILLSKSFGRQATESKKYSQENDNQVRLQVKLQMSGQWFFAMVMVFVQLLPVIIYLLAGLFIMGGQIGITAGVLVAFTTVQSRLLMPLMMVLRVALDIQTSGALFARIFEYLDLKPSITDKPNPRPVDISHLGSLEFRDVSFHYPDAKPDEKSTLANVSFKVDRGQHVAFVGPSGAGKTTIGYLIPRFYDATGGQVLFAGDDVRDLAQHDLVSHIGIVSQQSYLFHDTIAENVRYAKPSATMTEIIEACRQANILETIESFPDGFDTVVGEQGYRLSGGERQRIAIARVILQNAPVLILDEATSALDTVSERVVQKALDAASVNRTVISIAHRLSTIVHADQINVLSDGEIKESGTHAELLALNGIYANLYQEQLA